MAAFDFTPLLRTAVGYEHLPMHFDLAMERGRTMYAILSNDGSFARG
jgi:hypothetical protein